MDIAPLVFVKASGEATNVLASAARVSRLNVFFLGATAKVVLRADNFTTNFDPTTFQIWDLFEGGSRLQFRSCRTLIAFALLLLARAFAVAFLLLLVCLLDIITLASITLTLLLI